MREIKFRGKTKEGKWVYGSLIIHNAYDLNDGTHKPEPLRTFIQEQDVKWKNEPNDKCWTHYSYEVIPETVGMFTGLLDKNKKEIYGSIPINGKMSKGGDILIVRSLYETDEPIECRCVVEFSDGSFRTNFHNEILNSKTCKGIGNWEHEVIGNIHDNPELL